MRTYRAHSGALLRLVAPQTTSEVLDGEIVALSLSRQAALSGAVATGEATERASAWCARYVVGIATPDDEAPDLGDLAIWEVSEVVQAWLDPGEVVDLARQLIASCALPEPDLEAAGEHLHVFAGGGCECRVCRAEKPSPQDHVERASHGCLYATTPDHVWHMLAAWLPVRDEPVLDHPYWTYQLTRVWQSALGAARRAAADPHSSSTPRDRMQRDVVARHLN